MAASINTALLFLVNTFFSLYLFVLIVRLILVYVGANYFDPLTQFIVKLTNFIVKPLRRLLPNYRGIELSTLLLIVFLELIKFSLISVLNMGFMPNFMGILLLSFADASKCIIQIFTYAIILQAILSWVQPYTPLNRSLMQVTSPIMRPVQRIIPLVGGIDISPIFALIMLQLLTILLVNPLFDMGLKAL